MQKGRDYDFQAMEARWQEYWETAKTFQATEAAGQPKYWILDMFPYPSAAGLHVGHIEGYTATDIVGRYKKACGFNVLHPMGWDAFGLPAEQNALATGIHPAINTQNNIDAFRKQMKRVGLGIDWSREISTTNPEYYRWTQWIFLQLFQKGLAVVCNQPVWWCPALGTVLANEEVIDGKSERGHFPVEHRALRQWVLKITHYAESLLETLPSLDWPESTKRQQQQWIGRTEGGFITFPTPQGCDVTVFSTRPDTLFGVSFLAIAPEHPLLKKLTASAQQSAVQAYCESIASKSDLERTDLAKQKTGVFTGTYALHPFTGQNIPIWVADYVLMHHGTGALMGVPAHDTRDFEFAQTYQLPILPVLQGKEEKPLPFCEHGTLIHSGEFSGLSSEEAKAKILTALGKKNLGRPTVQYKLHDWLFSRQRYWGEPFPIVWVSEASYQKLKAALSSPFQEFLPKDPIFYEEKGQKWYAVPLTSQHLPLTLPPVSSYQPGEGTTTPLQNAGPDWLHVQLNLQTGEVRPSGSPAKGDWIEGTRETNTMPNWAGSCWYYLRYTSPRATDRFADPKALQYWGTPDLYVGGAEHAVLHLLYARFWHQFLYDCGWVPTKEPFTHLFHPGIILGPDRNKMSKSLGNVVNPNEVIDQYGADALRLYEMFMGPLEASKPWSLQNVEGVFRFLKKIWREYVTQDGELSAKFTDKKDSPALERLIHESIQKVTDAIEHLRLNTAISQLMICLNGLQKEPHVSHASAKIFLQLLAPFAPHIAEELWERCGEKPSILQAGWPTFDPSKCVQDTISIAIQVNGKLRGEISTSPTASQEEILKAAKKAPKVSAYLSKGTVLKEIYVPKKLVNFVVRSDVA
ncbi:MAG: leucine--tRNA ligase [Opitutales bacterium]|nr:leucine--tRNA ligase [Opitutales bacterium]